MKIFLTGATGFIGSHIAKRLVSEQHQVLALKRRTSNLYRCNDILSLISWIDKEINWENKVIKWNPDIIIHAAWLGVKSTERNNIEIQNDNIPFIDSLLKIAVECKICKFIGLGSQAEYGEFNSIVNESHPLNPICAYGKIKVKTQNRLQKVCEENLISWYWVRIFPIYGTDQTSDWLIPNLVSDMFFSKNSEKNMTLGQQVYSYLNVFDLAYALKLVIDENKESGIYNITSKNYMSIKEIATLIRDKVAPNFKLNFGILPYRKSQPMFMAGDSRKFINTFGEFEKSSLLNTLESIIEYQKKRNESI